MGNSPGKLVKEKGSASRRGVGADQKTARTDGPAVGEVLMGNIRTAASSTMGPVDFSSGYAPNEGVLRNANFSGNSGNPTPKKEGTGV